MSAFPSCVRCIFFASCILLLRFVRQFFLEVDFSNSCVAFGSWMRAPAKTDLDVRNPQKKSGLNRFRFLDSGGPLGVQALRPGSYRFSPTSQICLSIPSQIPPRKKQAEIYVSNASKTIALSSRTKCLGSLCIGCCAAFFPSPVLRWAACRRALGRRC